MNYKSLENGITATKGFEACGLHTGLKKKRKDACLIYSENAFDWAACFTKNKAKAHPVKWDENRLSDYHPARAIYINSGNANACVGEVGDHDCTKEADILSEALQIRSEEVLLASTGVIGVRLDMEKIERSIHLCTEKLSVNGGDDAAKAILTTDTIVKKGAFEFEIDGESVTIGYMAKGSGMIHPNMGTMLAFVTTDVQIERKLMQETLVEAVERSFNRITVDGDTSTNDSVFLMTTNQGKNKKITTREQARIFYEALLFALKDMAKKIVIDGEGATKFIEVQVKGTKTEEDAVKIGKAIATSSLVKTAFFGEDANWGRIICAIGYSGVDVSINHLSISLEHTELFKDGEGLDFSEERAKKDLEEKEIKLYITLDEGDGEADIWTCDFSYDYIKINGSYRS